MQTGNSAAKKCCWKWCLHHSLKLLQDHGSIDHSTSFNRDFIEIYGGGYNRKIVNFRINFGTKQADGSSRKPKARSHPGDLAEHFCDMWSVYCTGNDNRRTVIPSCGLSFALLEGGAAKEWSKCFSRGGETTGKGMETKAKQQMWQRIKLEDVEKAHHN